MVEPRAPRPARRIPFTKLHGCGNDYVYLDAWDGALPADLPTFARTVSNRHTGIGSDGLIVIGPTPAGIKADLRMEMWNADGSPSEMCGNGIRCAAKLAADHGRVRGEAIRVVTGAGVLTVDLQRNGRDVIGASVLMGQPRLTPSQVPVVAAGKGPAKLTLKVGGTSVSLVAIGMGNPHAVAFVQDVEATAVPVLGPLIEQHAKFPNRTNVEFVTRLPDEDGIPVLRQRTWERGAGETQACGTGACAVTVAAILGGVIPGREAIVRLNGGDLRIAWPADDAEVRMTGPAVMVYSGVWPG
jgi:diaminopimelate epimerase